MKKESLFKAIAILFPFIFILLLEAGLRLGGYGNNLSLFTEDKKQSNMLHLNRNVSLRYFLQQRNATTGNTERFLKEKPENLTRIFIQGESTAVGFPYFHNGAFPRMLEYQLRNDLPDINLEVINLSMTALNSFAVYDFAGEIIAQKPDAVIINAGQNEYYGALGVGSTGTLGSNVTVNRLGIWIRKTKTGQLLSKMLGGLSPEAPTKDYDKTLMERMVKTQEIPYDSKNYHAGINQYRKNMDQALEKYTRAGIRVYLTNPVSNLKDLKPFISINESDYNAQLHYEQAKEYYRNKDYPRAKEEFIKAKEYDALRFRAPEALHEVICELAEKYPEVILVDIRKALENYTEDKIIGSELLLEHVHPNLMGHYLISNALVESFKQTSFLYDRTASKKSLLPFRELPLTEVDSLTGVYANWLLREGWPFNEKMPAEEKREKTLEEAVAGSLAVRSIKWEAGMAMLMEEYVKNKDYPNAVKIGESFILEYPYEYVLYEQTVNLCIDGKDFEKGIGYAGRALKLKQDMAMVRQLMLLYMKNDQPGKAIPYLDLLIRSKEKVDFRPLKEVAESIVAMKDSLAKGTGDEKKLRQKILKQYTLIGNLEAARKYEN